MDKTYIYTLSCPLDESVRYVGKSNSPRARFLKHLSKKETNEKSLWIQQLKLNGLIPVFNVIDEVDISDWEFYEKRYISIFKASGAKLFNIHSGGEREFCHGKKASGKNKRKVFQLDSELNIVGSYDSVAEATRVTGINSAPIKNTCYGKKNSAGGFYWTYNPQTFIPTGLIKKFKQKVYQLNVDSEVVNTFESVREAGRITGILYSSIMKVCHKHTKSAGGYYWTYNLNEFIAPRKRKR